MRLVPRELAQRDEGGPDATVHRRVARALMLDGEWLEPPVPNATTVADVGGRLGGAVGPRDPAQPL